MSNEEKEPVVPEEHIVNVLDALELNPMDGVECDILEDPSIEEKPDNVRNISVGYARKINKFIEEGDVDQASRLYKQYIDNIKFPQKLPIVIWWAKICLNTETHLSRETIKEIIKKLKEALKYASKNRPEMVVLSEIHLNLGIAYLLYGNYFSDAKKHFEYACTIYPEWALPYYNLGNIYFSENNYERALELYNKALSLEVGLDDNLRESILNKISKIPEDEVSEHEDSKGSKLKLIKKSK